MFAHPYTMLFQHLQPHSSKCLPKITFMARKAKSSNDIKMQAHDITSKSNANHILQNNVRLK